MRQLLALMLCCTFVFGCGPAEHTTDSTADAAAPVRLQCVDGTEACVPYPCGSLGTGKSCSCEGERQQTCYFRVWVQDEPVICTSCDDCEEAAKAANAMCGNRTADRP